MGGIRDVVRGAYRGRKKVELGVSFGEVFGRDEIAVGEVEAFDFSVVVDDVVEEVRGVTGEEFRGKGVRKTRGAVGGVSGGGFVVDEVKSDEVGFETFFCEGESELICHF